MGKYIECETGNRPYLLGRSPESGRAVLYRPDCKLWSCTHCANVKAKQWSSRARAAIRDHIERDWHFVTLTLDDQSNDLSRQIQAWRKSWDVFSKRVRRSVAGDDLMYMVIPELSPSKKRLHAHMIVDWCFERNFYKTWYPAKGEYKSYWKYYSPWLHDNLKSAGLGYIYDIQELSQPDRAAYYVTKYVGKGLSENFPAGFRRVRVSQNFPTIDVKEVESEFLWTLIPSSREGRAALLHVIMNGEVVFDLEHQRPVTVQHPLISGKKIVDDIIF